MGHAVNKPETNVAMRWGINAIILISISLALYIGRDIFIPMIIATFLAAMLWPLATWFNQSGIPIPFPRFLSATPYVSLRVLRLHFAWGLACMTVIAVLIFCVLLVITAFGLGFSKLVIDASDKEKQREVYVVVRSKIDQIVPLKPNDAYFNENPDRSKVFGTFQEYVTPTSAPFLALLRGSFEYGGTVLWKSILITFILLFLLLEGRMLSRRVVEIFGPSTAIQGQAVGALHDMALQVRNYLVWRTIVNFGMAAILGVVYSAAGLKFAWAWALVSAMLWYIPYLGPIVAGFPPVLDAFVSCDSAGVALFILIFYICFVVVEGYVVVPVVMGRSMEMNATTVMLACLYWERVWGATGLFLAMPLMAAVKAVCTHVPEWRPWANLMSSREEDESNGDEESTVFVTEESLSEEDENEQNGEQKQDPKSEKGTEISKEASTQK